MNLLVSLTVLYCVLATGNAARILGMFPFPGKSHYNVYEPLMKKLAERGHDVVTVTHFPQKKPIANFTDVDVSSGLPSSTGAMSFDRFRGKPTVARMKMFFELCGVSICEPIFLHPGVQRIMQSKEKFDVMIIEMFATDCFLGISHALNIPITVAMISSAALPWSNDFIGNPDNPSYIPNWLGKFSDEMNFYQRLQNVWQYLFVRLSYRLYSDVPSYRIAKKYLGDNLPDFDSLRSRVSLVLTNGHPVVSTPRAQSPAFKELGGIHIPQSGPPPLPKDLKDYLDSQSKDGVIYFSLGSQLNSSTMPEQAATAFYKAFEQLPQQILWKCSKETMPKLPRNIKCIEWAPQLSILCHPNVRLFITHVGLLGSQEAVYCGVPILGMPLFGDQHLNMAYFVKKGLGLQLEYNELSYEAVLAALNEMLLNKSYTQVAQKASLQFRDRAIPPAQEGAYWVEYLIRHGPDSLKTEAVNLSWYQYLLLDVTSTIVCAIIIILATARVIIKTQWFYHVLVYSIYFVLCIITVISRLVMLVYELSKNFLTYLYNSVIHAIAQKKVKE